MFHRLFIISVVCFKQHWLWRDGWPCHRWFHHWGAFWFISRTELEPCTQEEEQLVSKDTAAYLAADRSPEADAMIIDGAFVAAFPQDYSNSVFLPYIFGQLQSVRRLDIVWDVYLVDSLMAGTKSKWGQGQRREVLPLAPLPSTWKSFLKNDENKSDLFCFLSTTKQNKNVY